MPPRLSSWRPQTSCLPGGRPVHYLRAATTTATIQDLFHLPLSMEAFEQFQELSVSLQSLQLNQSDDVWSNAWGLGLSFLFFQAGIQTVKWPSTGAWFSQMVVDNCLSKKKEKVFFWLVLTDRLSTRALLRRDECILRTIIVFSAPLTLKKICFTYFFTALLQWLAGTAYTSSYLIQRIFQLFWRVSGIS